MIMAGTRALTLAGMEEKGGGRRKEGEGSREDEDGL